MGFKKSIIFFVFFLLFSFFTPSVKANEEINKFGIHILEPTDIPLAAQLVNSSGGDWGWVTIVIRDNDLNFQKWQQFMNLCRENHLIPLVRLATHPENDIWVKPKLSDSQKWVEFLNQLNWPVKDRYLIIFNEPNHAKEWGGEINPQEYAQILATFASEFKKTNPNFQILNAGFDLAAPNSSKTMDVFLFWQKMTQAVPGIFNLLDGWASHSYPNHGFKGKPTDVGKATIRGYQWEIKMLKKYFELKKDLPVFITETGWPKKSKQNSLFYPEKTTAEYLKTAFLDLWLKDKSIKAITPFVLNYPQPPFEEFSWIDAQGNFSYQYEVIKNLPKKNWWPPQEEKYQIIKILTPPFMLTKSKFQGKAIIKNVGQSILGEKEEFIIPSKSTNSSLVYLSPLILKEKLKPFEEGTLEFLLITSTSSGEFNLGWENGLSFQLRVFQPSVIKKIEYSFWEKILLKIKEIFNF
ncbi:MAG: hypothetical protein ACPLKP_00845 [Microgenomates group bacterium]